jgi:hypothetical protein
MENKINIAELLKDCPQGMELDCTTWENVTFEKVVGDLIYVKRNNKAPSFDSIVVLNQYGCCTNNKDEKCRIFPKGKTTWEGFVPPCQFKDGDVISNSKFIAIFHKFEDGHLYYRCWHNKTTKESKYKTDFGIGYYYEYTYATEEEKEKLFQAIKDNGYKWNAETKTLEKLIDQKFKVGDRIILKDNPHNIPSIRIKAVTKSQYILENEGFFYIDSADKKYVLENKFDINTLVPFESRVLVRNEINQLWIPAFWGYKRDNGYATTFGWSQYCIPYEGNEHLLNTANDCDDFFKVWEEF